MSPRAALIACAVTACAWPATPAWGWSDPGHEIVAAIAYARLTPARRVEIDALLAADADTLTAPDFVSRATWADRWRDADRDTSRVQYEATRHWHYVNLQVDGGTLDVACNGHPRLPVGTPASRGPALACVVDKIDQFGAEWARAKTSKHERVLALKFLLHFVGDLHQPLHAADRHDAGGNDLKVRHGSESVPDNLHHYWDYHLVRKLGSDALTVARSLNATIGAAQARSWRKGTSADWAIESWTAARTVAYDIGGADHNVAATGQPVIELDAAYEQRALQAVRLQLCRAGVRLAKLLNTARR